MRTEGARTNGLDKSASLRQQLEEHRKNPSCAACHARMDALGFGLEHAIEGLALLTLDGGLDRAACLLQPAHLGLPGGATIGLPSRNRLTTIVTFQ